MYIPLYVFIGLGAVFYLIGVLGICLLWVLSTGFPGRGPNPLYMMAVAVLWPVSLPLLWLFSKIRWGS